MNSKNAFLDPGAWGVSPTGRHDRLGLSAGQLDNQLSHFSHFSSWYTSPYSLSAHLPCCHLKSYPATCTSSNFLFSCTVRIPPRTTFFFRHLFPSLCLHLFHGLHSVLWLWKASEKMWYTTLTMYNVTSLNVLWICMNHLHPNKNDHNISCFSFPEYLAFFKGPCLTCPKWLNLQTNHFSKLEDLSTFAVSYSWPSPYFYSQNIFF